MLDVGIPSDSITTGPSACLLYCPLCVSYPDGQEVVEFPLPPIPFAGGITVFSVQSVFWVPGISCSLMVVSAKVVFSCILRILGAATIGLEPKATCPHGQP